ncbi:MAG: hypothetical protein AAF264_02805, partial [Pseudomonadota bacterium]
EWSKKNLFSPSRHGAIKPSGLAFTVDHALVAELHHLGITKDEGDHRAIAFAPWPQDEPIRFDHRPGNTRSSRRRQRPSDEVETTRWVVVPAGEGKQGACLAHIGKLRGVDVSAGRTTRDLGQDDPAAVVGAGELVADVALVPAVRDIPRSARLDIVRAVQVVRPCITLAKCAS